MTETATELIDRGLVPDAGPCPPWCRRAGRDHPWDDFYSWPDGVTEAYRRCAQRIRGEVEGHRVVVQQVEYFVDGPDPRDQERTSDDARVILRGNGDPILTAVEARQLAGMLTAAADLLNGDAR